IQAVQDQLADHKARDGLAPAAAGDPENALAKVISWMRATGVPAGAQRLAVVISKADLLSSAGLELPGGSEEIADWLLGAGRVDAHMEREFADVRFFAVTS